MEAQPRYVSHHRLSHHRLRNAAALADVLAPRLACAGCSSGGGAASRGAAGAAAR